MLLPDLIRLTTSSFLAYRIRSFLTGLGIAIGITAVILLTSIGEGLHQFVLAEFNQFGTNLIAIQPGKTQTQGGNVGIFGSVRTISIEDAQALLHLPNVDIITAAVLESAEIPPRTRRLLFKTRNSQYWKNPTTEFQPNFVGISADGADFLVKRGVKLVGIDYLSVAPYHQSRPTHETFLKAGVVIIEGLNLAEIVQGRYTLYCLPLKLAGSDGAPARAILIGV